MTIFTDKQLKGLKSQKNSYRIFEKASDKGFGIKITPAGSISFFIQYSACGVSQRFMSLGRYPSVSLSEAREKCREARRSIDKGTDPQETQEDKEQTKHGTVSELFDYYITTMRNAGKKSWSSVNDDLNYNCANIMSLKAVDVTPKHIREILYQIISRGSEVQANRIRSYLHRAFKLGILHDNDPRSLKSEFTFGIQSNPVEAVPKNPGAERIGERALTFEELRILWGVIGLSVPMLVAIKLLVFYGCRSWELMGAQWSEFDFNAMVWSIPPERVKNGRWHLLPITPLAYELLLELKPNSRNSVYLFPGRYTDDKPIHET
jgi:integrase